MDYHGGPLVFEACIDELYMLSVYALPSYRVPLRATQTHFDHKIKPNPTFGTADYVSGVNSPLLGSEIFLS
jgi:hypothetical protein